MRSHRDRPSPDGHRDLDHAAARPAHRRGALRGALLGRLTPIVAAVAIILLSSGVDPSLVR